jgi:transglutaminase-like putative cysteine protease
MHLLLSWQISGNGSANIPARYATGYLGDINHVYSGAGDFSAWYEVFLNGNW